MKKKLIWYEYTGLRSTLHAQKRIAREHREENLSADRNLSDFFRLKMQIKFNAERRGDGNNILNDHQMPQNCNDKRRCVCCRVQRAVELSLGNRHVERGSHVTFHRFKCVEVPLQIFLSFLLTLRMMPCNWCINRS